MKDKDREKVDLGILICTAGLDIPAEWADKTVQVLVFLIAANAIGAVETKGQVSNTVWAGAVELA